MLSNTALDAPRLAVKRDLTARGAAFALVLALAGVAYPLAPAALYALATARLTSAAHILALAAGVFLVFLVPIVGLALLWFSSGSSDVRALRARGIGMLLVVAPVLTALSTTLAARAGVPARLALPIWAGMWAVATLGIDWRSRNARPLLPAAMNRQVRRVHRTFVALLLFFVGVHLAVNLTALRDLATYNEAAGWFRLVWRTPLGEPILIVLLLIQAGTGLLLALDAGIGRSTFEHLCQITAGLFIAVFLTSHTIAVAVLGRQLLDRGPDFTFASGGPAGLLGSAQAATLFPYYGLAVLAVFAHLGRPLRTFLVRRVGNERARVAALALVAAGLVTSVLLLSALVNPGSR